MGLLTRKIAANSPFFFWHRSGIVLASFVASSWHRGIVCGIVCGIVRASFWHRFGIVTASHQERQQQGTSATTKATGDNQSHQPPASHQQQGPPATTEATIQQPTSATRSSDGSSAPVAFAARDPVGIKPLYYGETSDGGAMAFASELKAMVGHVIPASVRQLPPDIIGHRKRGRCEWNFNVRSYIIFVLERFVILVLV